MLSGTWKLFNEIKVPLQSPGFTASGERRCLLLQLRESLISVDLSSGTNFTFSGSSSGFVALKVMKGEMEN